MQDSCFRDLLDDLAYIGDELLLFHYVPLYIGDATARMNKYAPAGFEFTNNDTVCQPTSLEKLCDLHCLSSVRYAINLRIRPSLPRQE